MYTQKIQYFFTNKIKITNLLTLSSDAESYPTAINMLQSSAHIGRILPATERVSFLASFLCLLTRGAVLVNEL